jgi:hypothetical protein
MAAVIGLVLLGLTATACTTHRASAQPRPPSATVTLPPAGGPATPSDPSDTGDTTASAVVGAAVAKSSRDQVVALHDLAVNAGQGRGIPAAQIPKTAAGISATLKTEISQCAALGKQESRSVSDLAASLAAYKGLADQLADWDANSSKPLAGSYFTALTTADGKWRTALKTIGAQSKSDLLSGLAPLLLPSSAP